MADRQEVIDKLQSEGGLSATEAAILWDQMAGEIQSLSTQDALNTALITVFASEQGGDSTIREQLQNAPESFTGSGAGRTSRTLNVRTEEENEPEFRGGDVVGGGDPREGQPDSLSRGTVNTDGVSLEDFTEDLRAELSGFEIAVNAPLDDTIIDEWLGNNRNQLMTWLHTDRVTAFAVKRKAAEAIQQEGLARMETLIADGLVDPQAAQGQLIGFGLAPATINTRFTTALQQKQIRDQLFNNPGNIAMVQSYGAESIEEFLAESREIFRETNPELAHLADTQDDAIFWLTVTESLYENVVDPEEAERVRRKIFTSIEEGRSFSYGEDGDGFTFSRDWERVSNMDGFNESEDLVRRTFAAVAEVNDEDAATVAPYVALIAKRRGYTEDYLGGDAISPYIGFESPGTLDGGPGGSGSPAGTDPLGRPFGGITRGGRYDQATKAAALEFERALSRYNGIKQLALIAIDDPMLAERIWNHGSPPTEEDELAVRKILDPYGPDLEAAGFYDGPLGSQYAAALLNSGGSAGSGPTQVSQSDPATLAEAYRSTFQQLFLREPDQSEIAQFVSSIQSAERSSAASAAQEIRQGINVFQGKSLNQGQTDDIVERFNVDPQARAQQQFRGSREYKALYAHLPTGVNEFQFQDSFRSKVAEIVGADDLDFNLDSVRAGMLSGDRNSAQRRAFASNAASDETVRGRIARNVRAIRGIV